MTCAWIANSHGCKVDEGSVHPCIINGKDYGQLLYTRRAGLVDACYDSRRAVRIRDLVDRSDPASGKMAKAIRRSSSSNSPAACDRVNAISPRLMAGLRGVVEVAVANLSLT